MPTKKRVIISQDYDNCYSILAEGNIDVELRGRNRDIYQNPIYSPYAYADRLRQLPQQYNAYLTQITEGANAVGVYVGSDRQSFALDRYNAQQHGNGSVFPALRALCSKRTAESCPWTFEPYLLADINFSRGTALGRIDGSTRGSHLEAPLPTQYTKKTKDYRKDSPSKIPMLIAQMKDAAKQYPGENLEFHFVDDRLDLIQDIYENLNPNDIPAGMTLKISRFDYIGVMLRENGSIGLLYTITSPRSLIEPPVDVHAVDTQVDATGASLRVPTAAAGTWVVNAPVVGRWGVAEGTWSVNTPGVGTPGAESITGESTPAAPTPAESTTVAPTPAAPTPREPTTNAGTSVVNAPVVAQTQVNGTNVELRRTVGRYLDYLKDKLAQAGIVPETEGVVPDDPNRANRLKKLITRYTAIAEVHSSIAQKEVLYPEDKTAVISAVQICKSNEPSWFERPLIEQLTEICNRVVCVFYRQRFVDFRSEERDLQQAVDDISSPRMGR